MHNSSRKPKQDDTVVNEVPKSSRHAQQQYKYNSTQANSLSRER